MLEDFKDLYVGKEIWYAFIGFDRDGYPTIKTRPTKIRITKIELDSIYYRNGNQIAHTEIVYKNGNTKEFFNIYEGQLEQCKSEEDIRSYWRSSSGNFSLTKEEAEEHWNRLIREERDHRRYLFERFNKITDRLII